MQRIRPTWPDLPTFVREAVQDIVGASVTAWVSQPAGYSPGVADRVVTAAGDRYFLKAAGELHSPETAALHRREAAITARLPEAVSAPRLLGSYDQQGWVALVLGDIDGHHPRVPWVRAEAEAAMGMLDGLATATTPCPIDHIPDAMSGLTRMFLGWERLDEGSLDGSVRVHHTQLKDMARHGCAVVGGDTLVHLDVRDDNLLVDRTGHVWLVDWPWAARGAHWIDSASLLLSVAHGGGIDPLTLINTSAVLSGTPADDVDGFLAGLAAFFTESARQPPPPKIPTLRAFQEAQGRTTLALLAQRRSW